MRADGVFSGGGIKGLAFAGGLQAAAEAGYDEWGKLAGTSAGSITAMALAVGYTAQGLREQLDSFDLGKIADYGPLGEAEIPVNIELRKGATHGKVLREWIEKLLAEAPHRAVVFGDLKPGKLRVVGSDLAHSRMVVFPDDVGLYIDEKDRPLAPAEFPIAEAVRISAGFPYFFPPLSLRDARTKKPGVLVDGGVTSAFPIFLFDKAEPRHPTWGFRLYAGSGPEKPSYTVIDGPLWPVNMLKAIVDTSMHALDNLEMIAFRPRTMSIPTGDIPTSTSPSPTRRKKSCSTPAITPPRPSSRPSPTGATPSARCRRRFSRGPEASRASSTPEPGELIYRLTLDPSREQSPLHPHGPCPVAAVKKPAEPTVGGTRRGHEHVRLHALREIALERPALAVARAQSHRASRDDGIRVQLCDGGIRSTLTKRDEVPAG